MLYIITACIHACTVNRFLMKLHKFFFFLQVLAGILSSTTPSMIFFWICQSPPPPPRISNGPPLVIVLKNWVTGIFLKVKCTKGLFI